MGYAHTYKCRDCRRSGEIYLSVGMMYPNQCEEAKNAAINGKMGKAWQKFVTAHPDGVFDCENVVFACTCGRWRNGPKMDYYVQIPGAETFAPYYTGDVNYRGKVRRSQHKCPACRKDMRVLAEEELVSLTCPVCKGELEFQFGAIMWD